MKHVVIGTAGHIDHGKSALVRALTGTDPDRLKEEKERGITIDLGFAFLRDGEALSLGFVDVPGHERFVKNMLAGVGGLDLVVLVVAADESVMPQTREHFDICRLLEIPRGIVVITKCDLVDADLRELAALETRELVAGSFLEGAPLLEVSAKTGEGISELKESLFQVAREITPRSSAGAFRLPVDRVFTMKGFGTVVTGTLLSGSVRQDEEVEILPRGTRARVRGLQVHGDSSPMASAGQRTAVNLQGLDIADVDRGEALVTPGAFASTMMIDASLKVLPSAPVPIKDMTRLHLHVGTAQVLARARVLGQKHVLAQGAEGLVQLRLEAPVVAARGDRFILRRYSPLETIAGGVILDAEPRKHSVTSEEVAQEVGALADCDEIEAALHFVREAGLRGMSEEALARRLGIARAALPALLEPALSSKAKALFAVSQSPPRFVLPQSVSDLSRALLEVVTSYQKAHPLEPGMPKGELREKTAANASSEVFEWTLADLAGKKKLQLIKDRVATADHRIEMSPEETRAREQLLQHYKEAGYSPKSLGEIASAARSDVKMLERVQRLLLKEGALVPVADGMVFHRDVLERLKAALRDVKPQRERIDVSFFKEMAGVTRKHAIPLLEWLDRQRVTRRSGNERIIL